MSPVRLPVPVVLMASILHARGQQGVRGVLLAFGSPSEPTEGNRSDCQQFHPEGFLS